jgi:indolepyruvate ferredoxin oxidoreductase alpha subunit
MKPALMTLTPRPPRLCDGCGHADAFNALKKACTALGISDPRFFGDIGCYTLGHYEPYNTIDTCVEMGASAGMMMGAGLAGLEPSIGIIGDSTFFHSALGTLVTMATTKANVNLVVLDNRITAMTGQQPTVAVDMIEHVAKGVGFPPERIHTLIPLPKNLEANTNKLVEILGSPGPKVIIFKRECIHSLRKGLNR